MVASKIPWHDDKLFREWVADQAAGNVVEISVHGHDESGGYNIRVEAKTAEDAIRMFDLVQARVKENAGG